MTGLQSLFLAAGAALVCSALLTPVAIRLALRYGFLDRPGGYKAHAAATPLLGGLPVSAGFLGGVMVSLAYAGPGEHPDVFAFGLGAVIIIAAGLIDDLHGLSPTNKLAWQAAAAAVAGLTLAVLGVRVDLFLGWSAAPLILLTVLWIVGVTNAVNLMDNMNGLCAGLGTLAAACLALFNLRTGEYAVAAIAASLSGACLGFVFYNWPKGRIFLGDTGSMLIGYSLASLSVMGVYTRGAEVPALAVLAPLFILAVPLLDVLAVVLLRLRDGRAPWRGDRCHLSHRLVARGLGPVGAVGTVWLAILGCGVAALLLPTVGIAEAPLLLLLLTCLLGAVFAAAGSQGLE
jgi:UDP-GlcNAc:undecaprenyl-phosphate GlcNAc-1-phosphate transferase